MLVRGPIKCADCPTIIQNPWPNQIRCVPCGDKRRAEQRRARALIYYYQQKQEAEPEAAPEANKLQRSKAGSWDLTGKSGTQIEIEARALGLSYGRYGALIRSGMIEQHCAEKGLGADGLQYVDKIWKDFLRQKAEREKVKMKGHKK